MAVLKNELCCARQKNIDRYARLLIPISPMSSAILLNCALRKNELRYAAQS
jgi:hypothetical protein